MPVIETLSFPMVPQCGSKYYIYSNVVKSSLDPHPPPRSQTARLSLRDNRAIEAP